jgi:hypothetical protein
MVRATRLERFAASAVFFVFVLAVLEEAVRYDETTGISLPVDTLGIELLIIRRQRSCIFGDSTGICCHGCNIQT